jgi:hypothetical protein
VAETAYLLPPLTFTQTEILSAHTETTPQTIILDGENELIARLYSLPDDTPFLSEILSNQMAQEVNFADTISLTNYRVEPQHLQPGEIVTLHLDWQANRQITSDYHLFIHMFDVTTRQRWGQLNTPLTGILFDVYRWPVGLTVPDVHQFQLPADAPTATYRFEIGLYQPITQNRLPVEGDDKIILGKFFVGSPPTPTHPLTNIQFDNAIDLLGFDMKHPQIGEALEFTLYWQAKREIDQDYTIFNHVLDATGQIQAQFDSSPQHGNYPTNWWSLNEVVSDSYVLPLPDDLPTGQYTLRVGLYDSQTGQRLSLQNQRQDFFDLPFAVSRN